MQGREVGTRGRGSAADTGPELSEEPTLLPTQWTGAACDLMLGAHRVLKHNCGPQVSSARLVHGVEEEISAMQEYDRRAGKERSESKRGERKEGQSRAECCVKDPWAYVWV